MSWSKSPGCTGYNITYTGIGKKSKAFFKKTNYSWKKVQNIVIPIAQILVAAGNIVVVIAVVVMGIKYMVANPEDRAKLKSQLVGLAVATCVIFGAQFIWKICYSLFSTL